MNISVCYVNISSDIRMNISECYVNISSDVQNVRYDGVNA